MSVELLAVVLGFVGTIITAVFLLLARRTTPKVERHSKIVDDALKMVDLYRIENRDLRRRIEELQDDG